MIILRNQKLYKNILVYDISYKTLIGAKPLRIRLDKVDWFIGVYNGIIYLVSLGVKKYYFIYKRIRYLIRVKSGITYVISHNYAKIKVDSYDSLRLENTLTFHNLIIIIKSIWNKYRLNYYYDILLEKCLYQSSKNNDNK